jgi:hypothetical protein
MTERNRPGYAKGDDAAYIKPKLIPDEELLPRDDSGGPEWDPYTQEFGDGGEITGAKAHLSAKGGSDDKQGKGDEIDEYQRRGGAKSVISEKGSAKSKKEAKE